MKYGISETFGDHGNGKTLTCWIEFIPTKIVEMSLFNKLYCMANFDMFLPFSLQWAAAALQAAWWKTFQGEVGSIKLFYIYIVHSTDYRSGTGN